MGRGGGVAYSLDRFEGKNRLITVTCIIHDFVENGVSFSGKLIWHRREISTVFA